MHQRPGPDEFAPFFQGYVARVPDGDVIATLERQGAATVARLAGVADARGGFAYAPGKWTVRRVVQHVADGERLFAYRALCLARGEQASLPPFDEDLYAANDGSDQRTLRSLTEEFASVRAATLTLLRGLSPDAWSRRGLVSGRPASVRAQAWIAAGHELHHLEVLRERYGVAGPAGA
ncbi:MAG: DinB family protein [Planctomycetes bacterium]|nr:DinB family protein [Planctomycetota bacterium]